LVVRSHYFIFHCQLEWQTKEEQIKALQDKAAEAQWQPWL
jgi:hypothetical protein